METPPMERQTDGNSRIEYVHSQLGSQSDSVHAKRYKGGLDTYAGDSLFYRDRVKLWSLSYQWVAAMVAKVTTDIDP